jgi:large subunit ribosomal protein L30
VELKITLAKSTIGAIPKHRKTVQALGLRKTGGSVVKQDNPAVRGMIKQVSYLLKVTEA